MSDHTDTSNVSPVFGSSNDATQGASSQANAEQNYPTLDLASFPLEGVALIEASAGTGKTYAVSNLLLRYVLELDYRLEEILVVTFTDAATQELRVRAREKISEAIIVMESVLERIHSIQELGQNSEIEFGSLLKDVCEDTMLFSLLVGSKDLSGDLLKLRLAERSIDLAEIHTIHGFCQKVAREHAVLLNLTSEQVLKEDLKPMFLEVCQDLWRSEILKLPVGPLAFIRDRYKSPDGLRQALRMFSSRQPERISPYVGLTNIGANETPLQWWSEKYSAFEEWVKRLGELISNHIDDVIHTVENSELKNVNKKVQWLQTIKAWSEEAYDAGALDRIKLDKFFDSCISQEAKKGKQAPKHMFFVALEEHFEQRPTHIEASFVQALNLQVKTRLQQRKVSEQILGFDDLITQVNQAVISPDLSHDLATRLRQKYKVALIDEFQDTDAQQYPIFSGIFGVNAYESSSELKPSLVLIGDPKQAIYGFRGGDMATYLRARNDVEQSEFGQIFTMRHNWRSSNELLDALNYLYRPHANPFLERGIQYVEVSSGRDLSRADLGSALHISRISHRNSDDEKLRNKENTQQLLAAVAASQVSEVLHSEHAASFQSKDVVVLVRDRNEAALMREHLSMLGIKASYDDRASVFQSTEAASVLLLLSAIREPDNEKLMMQCMSDPLWGIKDQNLRELNQYESAANYWLECFLALQADWYNYGVLAVLRKALQLLGALDYWRALAGESINWERILTNIGQLGELLQEQSQQQSDSRLLLHWLSTQINDVDAEQGKEREMRLESDDALVRIITIHQSKGLEYPVVFLPFLFTSRDSKEAWYYDDQGRLSLALEPDDSETNAASRERLAEDCRLLYVALTRAKYCCYIGTSEFHSSSSSVNCSATALGYLLSQRDTVLTENPEEGWLAQSLEGLSGHAHIQYQFWSDEEVATIQGKHMSTIPTVATGTPVSLRTVPAINSAWRVHSFTGLMNEHHFLVGETNHSHTKDNAPDELSKHAIDILNFPKGSQAGTFLHTLFEHIDFESADLIERYKSRGGSLQAHIAEMLSAKQLVPTRKAKLWAEYLARWLKRILNCPLGQGVQLGQLSGKDYKVEADFYFRVDAVDAAAINALIQTYDPAADPLAFERFDGHIKGAIDLMLRSDNKYFVLDYKSNHLGFRSEDYSYAQLKTAITEHRYDLQYLLYTVALHRLLKLRLGEKYDYGEHLGGVFYLFLRGLELKTEAEVDKENLPGVYFVKPPRALIEGLNDVLEGGLDG